MRRNLTKLKTNYSSELVGKLWIKKNTGDYGAVSLPAETDCISVRSDTSIAPEKNDEQSNAKSNRRVRYKGIRMRQNNKLNISLDLDFSGVATTEWAIGKIFDLALGKKTAIGATQGASAALVDPTATKAGISVATAADLNGFAGNYVTLQFVLGGASGTASLDATASPDFVVTYYNDSTVASVVSAIDADSNLACAEDAIGDDATDLFKDLLANCGLANGSKIYLAGGCEAGTQYDNSEAPDKDACLVYNREKTGQVITGGIIDKISIEVSEKAPVVKVEGAARYSLVVGYTTASAGVSNAAKIYVADPKQFGEYDDEAPQLLDIIDNDGVTKKYSGVKLLSKGYDSGAFITIDTNVTLDSGDFIAFHEPNSYNPTISPLNGLGGHLKIDGESFPDYRNLKFEMDNNHEVFDNLVGKKSISGYAASKYLNGKFSVTVLLRKDKMGLHQKLTASETIEVPVEFKIGSVAGKQLTVFLRFVQIKAPDLSDKAEAVQEVTLEGEVVASPEADNIPSIVLATH